MIQCEFPIFELLDNNNNTLILFSSPLMELFRDNETNKLNLT